MKRIGLLSDTHGFLDPKILVHFEVCDEVWHAGDFGPDVADRLASFRPLRGVHGNIDGPAVRSAHPKHQRFLCEGLDVWMTHIGGYPDRYDRAVRDEIHREPPGLFITGHSHILRVMRDLKLENKMLHFNPGAAGRSGLHIVRTVLIFSVDNAVVKDVAAIELGPRQAPGKRSGTSYQLSEPN